MSPDSASPLSPSGLTRGSKSTAVSGAAGGLDARVNPGHDNESRRQRTGHAPAHVEIGPLTIGNDLPYVLIAGPCQIESRAHALETAAALQEICMARGLGLIYKSSFDKANRTSVHSPRGVGLAQGIEVLAEVKER